MLSDLYRCVLSPFRLTCVDSRKINDAGKFISGLHLMKMCIIGYKIFTDKYVPTGANPDNVLP